MLKKALNTVKYRIRVVKKVFVRALGTELNLIEESTDNPPKEQKNIASDIDAKTMPREVVQK